MNRRDPQQELGLLMADLRRKMPGMVAVAVCGSDDEREALLQGPLRGVAPNNAVIRPGAEALFAMVPSDFVLHIYAPTERAEAERWWTRVNRFRSRWLERPGQVVVWTERDAYGHAASWAPDLFSMLAGTFWLDGARIEQGRPRPPRDVWTEARRRWSFEHLMVRFPFELGGPQRRLSAVWIPRRVRGSDQDALTSLTNEPKSKWLVTPGAGTTTLLRALACRMVQEEIIPVMLREDDHSGRSAAGLVGDEAQAPAAIDSFRPWEWVLADAWTSGAPGRWQAPLYGARFAEGWERLLTTLRGKVLSLGAHLAGWSARVGRLEDDWISLISEWELERDDLEGVLEAYEYVLNDALDTGEDSGGAGDDADLLREDLAAVFEEAWAELHKLLRNHQSGGGHAESYSVFESQFVRGEVWRVGSRLMLKDGVYVCVRELELDPLTRQEALTLLAHRLGSASRAADCLSCLPPEERRYNPIQFMPLDLLGIAAIWERDGDIPASVKDRHRRLGIIHLEQHENLDDIPIALHILRALWPRFVHQDWLPLSEGVQIVSQALEAHSQGAAAASWLGLLTQPDGVLLRTSRGLRPRYPHLVRALVTS